MASAMEVARQIEPKVCYYDILGIPFDSDETDIKRAYKQLALKVHPDKADPENAQICTRAFQKVKDAYQCLSNPKDRKWYDSHRKFITKEAQEETEGFVSKVNIWNYFGTCYSGFNDEPGGFYTVYRNLFDQIANEELQFDNNINFPSFGHSNSPWEVTGAFYKFWLQFNTRRTFAKEYKLCEAENRQIRRLMERENKKNESRLRKEFSANVQKLCSLVKKRDLRVERHYKEIGVANSIRAMQIQSQKDAKKESDKIAREEKLKSEREYWLQIKREKENLVQQGQAFLDVNSNSENEDLPNFFNCDICRKTFKSEKQLESHLRSKKHISLEKSLKT